MCELAVAGAVQAAAESSPAVIDLQNRLQQYLGTHVVLHHDEKRGRIEIEYYGNDDLQRILSAIGLPRMTSDRGRTTWSS